MLSALHGLAMLDEWLKPYDLRMGQPGSVTAERLRAQARALGVDAAQDVTVLAGSVYALAARAVWPHAATPLAGLGIGLRIRELADIRKQRSATSA
ncbi:DUF6884 domain-containing protein [Streptomyces sp. NPDC005708]|uniref:DUF6884 domain-containing protein n=1 Tax=Streptomyces sp. NPDC005708 TaxID=3154564 RepID=UPI00340D7666